MKMIRHKTVGNNLNNRFFFAFPRQLIQGSTLNLKVNDTYLITEIKESEETVVVSARRENIPFFRASVVYVIELTGSKCE